MEPHTGPNSGTRDLLPAVRSYIDRHEMIRPGDGIVIGVSGGQDSVSLLDVLYRLRKPLDITLYVAHLNHQLRGPASDADQQFVTDLAASMGSAVLLRKSSPARTGLS